MKKLDSSHLIRKLRLMLGSIIITIIYFTNVNAQNSANINLNNTHQIIRGFGAANILPWRPDMTQNEINKAFGTGDGQIGFSILRLRLPSDENSFSINLPTAKAAHSMGVTLIASPWSPPASMKTNNNIVGGELMESRYDDFAAYLKNYADYMSANDAPIYAISVQNEPDVTVTYESCDYNPSQMLKFVKENAQSIGTKVIAPESFQFRRNLSDPLLNDSTACANFDILGGHIYGGGLATYPLAESKGKEIWMTEYLVLETDWGNNLAVGKGVLDCLNDGMSAYVWWYIVRFYGPIYDEGTDPRTPAGAVKGEISKRGYVMSNFARFIRPGYYRIDADVNPQAGIYLSAYKSDSTIVIVAINNSSQNKTQTFNIENGTAAKFKPYVTTQTKNCIRETDIPVTNNSFIATLEASSITTFVSEENIVSVGESSAIPKSYNLFQNYPNPFNPSTKINYSIPRSGYITLKVYNLLGVEVATLFEGVRQEGNYTATFNGSTLASGVYFYRMTANNFVETKKLMLLK